MYIKCKYCGATINKQDKTGIDTCSNCGTQQTLPLCDNERFLALFDRANQLRQSGKFERALSACALLLKENVSDAELYWLVVLCEYKVVYAVDIDKGIRMPTVNTDDYTSIFENEHYLKAIQLASDEQKILYVNAATLIDDVATGKVIVNTASEEKTSEVQANDTAVHEEIETETHETEEKTVETDNTYIQVETNSETETEAETKTDDESESAKVYTLSRLPIISIVSALTCIVLIAIVTVIIITVKNASKPTVNESLQNIPIGETFVFGKYEQDNDPSSKEDIEWVVLNKAEGQAMLISKYGLDVQPYNTVEEDVTWESCSLRKWLNNEFYNEAFSEEEKAMIPSVEVKENENPEYGSLGGNDTVDKVFLLNIYDALDFFESNESRLVDLTEYAKSKEPYVFTFYEDVSYYGRSYYWLRSPGDYNDLAAVISFDGTIQYFGQDVEYDKIVVRPVICLNFE